MSDLLYGKKIVTESYYDGKVQTTKNELEVNIFSTRETILKDIIDALGVISGGETTKLSLDIRIDAQGRYRLIKRWSIDEQS